MIQYAYTLVAFTLVYFLAHIAVTVFVHEPRKEQLQAQQWEQCSRDPYCRENSKHSK